MPFSIVKCLNLGDVKIQLKLVVPISKCQRVNRISKQEFTEFCNIYLGYF